MRKIFILIFVSLCFASFPFLFIAKLLPRFSYQRTTLISVDSAIQFSYDPSLIVSKKEESEEEDLGYMAEYDFYPSEARKNEIEKNCGTELQRRQHIQECVYGSLMSVKIHRMRKGRFADYPPERKAFNYPAVISTDAKEYLDAQKRTWSINELSQLDDDFPHEEKIRHSTYAYLSTANYVYGVQVHTFSFDLEKLYRKPSRGVAFAPYFNRFHEVEAKKILESFSVLHEPTISEYLSFQNADVTFSYPSFLFRNGNAWGYPYLLLDRSDKPVQDSLTMWFSSEEKLPASIVKALEIPVGKSQAYKQGELSQELYGNLRMKKLKNYTISTQPASLFSAEITRSGFSVAPEREREYCYIFLSLSPRESYTLLQLCTQSEEKLQERMSMFQEIISTYTYGKK